MVKRPYEFEPNYFSDLERDLKDRKNKIKRYHKICLKCGQLKMLFKFSTDKRSRDGRLGVCKECKSIESLKYYYDHKEEILIRVEEYRRTHEIDRSVYFENYRKLNKKHLKKIAKLWYKKNKKAIKERSLKYYADNKEACQAIRKLWIKNNKEKIKKYNWEYRKLRASLE
ncbi:hypothetical protein E3V08_02490 [Candidatus Atribacteria bacterium MT.SAG.1]|nr:hypothetical protein E3V08_02490 [Candidatus Atribacteria bacterium MT.SAG.1]